MYKTIVFDLDDTLIDNTENIKQAFKEVLIYRKEKYTEEKFDRFYELDKRFWGDRASGRMKDPHEFSSKEERRKWIRAQRFIQYFKDITLEEAIKINNLYMEESKNKVIEIEGAKEIIEYLYNKGYEIVIATNGPKIAVSSKLEKIEILEYIRGVLSAEEVGHMKPHKEFYKVLLKKIINSNIQEILFVGDELEKDIKGGIENNIDTCWFNKRNEKVSEYIPKYEIKELLELKNIL